jgi:endonuclease G
MKKLLFGILLLAVACNQPGTNTNVPDNGQNQNQGQEQEQEKLDVKVITGQPTVVTSTSATITATYRGATTEVRDRGFVYGTAENKLDQTAGLNSTTEQSGNFSATISSLEPETTYYYKAYVTVWSNQENKYVDFLGDLESFVTETEGPAGTGLQYLGCYEMPAFQLKSDKGYSNTGREAFGDTNWYNYETTNASQMVVTHTYSYNGKQYRNWTAIIDGGKKAPQLSAFVMHQNAYPDNNVGRKGNWTQDPGVPASWQSCFASSGHSRGHFVASNYRQACLNANYETFYYTNQALQYQNGFNDGIWNTLENAVEANAPSGRDTLYVNVGVLYETDKSYDGVPCPSHFYKCLMKCSFDSTGKMTAAKGVAYIFENKSYSGSNYSSYSTTIDAIEQRSGWNLFANVPKDLQDAAEKMSADLW